MADIAHYQAQVYADPPCWLLVADFYAREMALPCAAYRTVTSSVRAIAAQFRLALHKRADGFQQIAEPVEGCVVLLGRSPRLGVHHCGVWTGGRVLHALPSGVVHEDIATIGDVYGLVEYWARPEMLP
jgi:hypothetical protein